VLDRPEYQSSWGSECSVLRRQTVESRVIAFSVKREGVIGAGVLLRGNRVGSRNLRLFSQANQLRQNIDAQAEINAVRTLTVPDVHDYGKMQVTF